MNKDNTQQKQRGNNRRSKRTFDREESKFDTLPISIRRVTKVGSGSKRMRFSVAVVVGDRKGKVGVGLGKGPDVRSAMEKAVRFGKKNLIDVPIVGTTIPHEIKCKVGAAEVFLKPALPGTGVIAGGAVRAVVELAGIKDVLSKRFGANNKLNNVYATIEALKQLESQKKDASFKIKPMYSEIKIETLADIDRKVIAKKRNSFEKKPVTKSAKKSASAKAPADRPVAKTVEKVEVKKEDTK